MARAIVVAPDAQNGSQTPPGMQRSGFEADPAGLLLINYAVVFVGLDIPGKVDMATVKVSFLDGDTGQQIKDKLWAAILAEATTRNYTVQRSQVIWTPVNVGL